MLVTIPNPLYSYQFNKVLAAVPSDQPLSSLYTVRHPRQNDKGVWVSDSDGVQDSYAAQFNNLEGQVRDILLGPRRSTYELISNDRSRTGA